MLRVKSVTGTLLVLIAACAGSACYVGMSAGKYRPAQQPAGVSITMITPAGKAAGELLAIRDTGVIILIGQKVHMVPYTAILSSDIDQTSSSYAISNRAAPNADVQTHLRLLSRFPQGLTAELLGQLLQAYGQTEMITP
jgi:hypothetical protein